MTFGLTAEGFFVKSIDDIEDEVTQDLLSAFGNSSSAEVVASNLRQSQQPQIRQLALLWEALAGVYGSQYVKSAVGVSLENIGAITGAQKLRQAKSVATVVAVGDNAKVLAANRRIQNSSTLTYWTNPEAATITTLTARATLTAYVVGDLVSSSGNVYYCTTAGTSSAGAGPSGTGNQTDGTVVWRYIAAGSAAVVMEFESEDYGEILGATDDIDTISSPESGWDAVTNPTDADEGRLDETDAEFRLRREQLLRMSGNAALDAIRADVLNQDNVPGVTQCTVFENTSMVTDGDGVPAKAIEVLVQGGEDADIAATIWESKAAGIETYGTETVNHVDSQGTTRVVKFSRPTEKNVWIIVNGTKNDNYPVATDTTDSGDDQIKQALVAYSVGLLNDDLAQPFLGYQVGDDVYDSALYAPVFTVAGVVKITSILIGFSDPPTLGNDLTIGSRELAVFDTARITVNMT